MWAWWCAVDLIAKQISYSWAVTHTLLWSHFLSTNELGIHCAVKRKSPGLGVGGGPLLPGAGRVTLDWSLRLCGPCLSHEASDKLSSSFSSPNSHPSNIWNHFGVDWDVLCLISTRNKRASLDILPGRHPCLLYSLVLFLCFVAHAF